VRQDTKNLPFDQKPITGLSEACSQFQSYDVSEFRRESADTKIYTPIPTRTSWKKATFTLCRNEKGSSRSTNPPPQTTSSWITSEQPDQLGLVLQLHRQTVDKIPAPAALRLETLGRIFAAFMLCNNHVIMSGYISDVAIPLAFLGFACLYLLKKSMIAGSIIPTSESSQEPAQIKTNRSPSSPLQTRPWNKIFGCWEMGRRAFKSQWMK